MSMSTMSMSTMSHGNVIFDTLDPHAFKKYSTWWVFQALLICVCVYLSFSLSSRSVCGLWGTWAFRKYICMIWLVWHDDIIYMWSIEHFKHLSHHVFQLVIWSSQVSQAPNLTDSPALRRSLFSNIPPTSQLCFKIKETYTFKRKIWKQVIFILHLVLTRMPLMANIKPLNDLACCYLLVNNCMHICISPVTIIVPLSPQPKHYIFHHSQLHAPQRDVGQPVDGWSEEAAQVETLKHHPCHRQTMRQVNNFKGQNKLKYIICLSYNLWHNSSIRRIIWFNGISFFSNSGFRLMRKTCSDWG